jgi:predicted dehydrogenase
MITARPLGAAVVGLGVGEHHARAYAALPSCKVSALYDLDRGKAERLAAELSTRVAGDYSEILGDAESALVSIATFDQDHGHQVVAALEAGKHVFVEKPICRTEEELALIKRTWRDHSKQHIVSNLVLRAAPLYLWLREAVRAGELGEIYAFDGDYLYGRLHKITEQWRGTVDDYSVMLGGGVHMVDLMLWLTGQRPTSVLAAGNRISTRGTAFRYHDFVTTIYGFPSGLVGRITANFGCVHRHQHVVRVFGTRGTFIYDDMGPRFHTSRDPNAIATVPSLRPEPASKGALIPEFVAAILAGTDAGPAFQAESDLIAACVAADRALVTEGEREIAYD